MDTTKKVCSTCNILKPISDYYKDSRKKYGVYGECKDCVKEKTAIRKDRKISAGILPKPKYRRLSSEEKSKIEDLYKSGVGAHRISKLLGRSKISVLKEVRKLGIIRYDATYRKYKFINEEYFDIIDSDEKAYFLGLLWADGCNYRREEKNKNAFQVIISLQEQDGYIVRELSNRLYGNSDIVKFVNKDTDYDAYTRQNQTCLRVPSKHISDVLLNYGMCPRKSFDAEMPINISWTDDLYRSFIRGMFDGDGSVYYNTSSKSYGVSIIASTQQANQINSIIECLFGKKMSFEFKDQYTTPMGGLTFHGNQIVFKFLNWLYEGSTIHLRRKYNKYLQLSCMVGSNNSP